MPHISRSALVPFSAEQMYKLVDNVDAYKDFLPWCGDSQELARGDDWVEGSVTISKGSLNKKFTTKNYLHKNKQIELTLVDGPFSDLQGFWLFESLKENACKISLELDYEFSNKMLGLIVGPVFNQIANAMVDSFVKEAQVKYG
jgi:ribosome-associated toxin RatA of RatAB toxin-antitoxin module